MNSINPPVVQTNVQNLNILYEDNHLIIINKRCGDIIQGDKTGDTPLSELVKQFIKIRDNKPGNVYLGVTHRIDRPTSGLIIFTKTSKALTRMNALFAKKKITKTYWAVVENKLDFSEKSLINWLWKNPKNNKSTVYPLETQHAKQAILHYKILTELDNYTALNISLETGRHHQIRAQLAAIGNPIKGDLKYGSKRSNPNGGIYLHAQKVSFIHPVQDNEITITAPTPDDVIWNAVLDQIN